MGKYFGTDGFRGEANVNLTVEHAFKVGRYIGYYYGRSGSRYSGCARRRGSPPRGRTFICCM